MNLQPIVTFRQGRNRAWRVDSAERSWLIKEYVGPQGRENRDREKARLKLWLTRGYPVPAVGALTIPELDGTPWLAMEWLEGVTLQEYLSDRYALLAHAAGRAGGFFAGQSPEAFHCLAGRRTASGPP